MDYSINTLKKPNIPADFFEEEPVLEEKTTDTPEPEKTEQPEVNNLDNQTVDLKTEIAKKTEYREPAKTDLFEPEADETNSDDFVKMPAKSAKKPIDENSLSFTTDMFVQMIDSGTSMIFLQLNRRKLRNNNFKNKDEFEQARANQYMDESEISALPADEQIMIRALQRKYKRFCKQFEEKTEELEMTEREREFIANPLKRLCRANNLDLPPGWALAFGLFNLFSNRMIDLFMD